LILQRAARAGNLENRATNTAHRCGGKGRRVHLGCRRSGTSSCTEGWQRFSRCRLPRKQGPARGHDSKTQRPGAPTAEIRRTDTNMGILPLPGISYCYFLRKLWKKQCQRETVPGAGLLAIEGGASQPPRPAGGRPRDDVANRAAASFCSNPPRPRLVRSAWVATKREPDAGRPRNGGRKPWNLTKCFPSATAMSRRPSAGRGSTASSSGSLSAYRTTEHKIVGSERGRWPVFLRAGFAGKGRSAGTRDSMRFDCSARNRNRTPGASERGCQSSAPQGGAEKLSPR